MACFHPPNTLRADLDCLKSSREPPEAVTDVRWLTELKTV